MPQMSLSLYVSLSVSWSMVDVHSPTKEFSNAEIHVMNLFYSLLVFLLLKTFLIFLKKTFLVKVVNFMVNFIDEFYFFPKEIWQKIVTLLNDIPQRDCSIILLKISRV